jgi:hypothetical protein
LVFQLDIGFGLSLLVDTNVAPHSTLVNGDFALIFSYGKYVIEGKQTDNCEEYLLH